MDLVGIIVRVFANGPGDLGSIPGRVIPKTQKMLLDATLLNTQQLSGAIQGKELRPPLHLGVVAIEKGAFGSPSTAVANYNYYYYYKGRYAFKPNQLTNQFSRTSRF